MASQHPRTQEILDAVLARAKTDREFRRALLSDPRAAVADAFSVRIPDDVRIKFIERDPDLDALVVLPDLEDPSVALSDDELEQVSGGGGNAQMMWSGSLKGRRRAVPRHL